MRTLFILSQRTAGASGHSTFDILGWTDDLGEALRSVAELQAGAVILVTERSRIDRETVTTLLSAREGIEVIELDPTRPTVCIHSDQPHLVAEVRSLLQAFVRTSDKADEPGQLERCEGS